VAAALGLTARARISRSFIRSFSAPVHPDRGALGRLRAICTVIATRHQGAVTPIIDQVIMRRPSLHRADATCRLCIDGRSTTALRNGVQR
jgi:hypothetical protein